MMKVPESGGPRNPEEFRFGRQPVLEALRSGQPLNRVWIMKGTEDGPVREIRKLAREAGVPVQDIARTRLEMMAGGINHQGVAASVAPRRYLELDDLLQPAVGEGEYPLLVALDGLEDPQNLGGILRTVEAAGGQGVIITRRRSVQVTEAVARVSAGASDLVPVARVSNLAQSLRRLKQEGYWVLGLSPEGAERYDQIDYQRPLVLVVGGEGKGLSHLIREMCDELVSLPMRGRIASLNAAVATAIVMYEAIRQRRSPAGMP